ncbi:hypothetical protein ABT369_42375 [Dactylosporangium sp. NPDC000244]|uniref:hypothetical protein n=1 Tax=Dactylosporangium sp. NPDC000244 TaxID=3154365 RepID=UPI0033275286
MMYRPAPGVSELRRYRVRYLSDVNLRAVLSVLIDRAGGKIEISNGELYDAMLPDNGQAERFEIEELSDGLRLTTVPRPGLDGARR